MGLIRRTVHVKHSNGQKLGGLLHYVTAASNRVSKGYRRGVRGRKLYRMAVHHTGVYNSRPAEYIVRDVLRNHKAWRTNRLADPHARAPHYRNGIARTDQFEMAFDDTARRWSGSPAIWVAVYGRGHRNCRACSDGRNCADCKACSDCKECKRCKECRDGVKRKDDAECGDCTRCGSMDCSNVKNRRACRRREWMEFPVPPYVVEQLTESGAVPKVVSVNRDEIYVTYEMEVADREPKTWAGVDMNAKNNTYAYPNGMTGIVRNEYHRWYNAAYSKVLKVKRRGDARVMAKHTKKAWDTYKNRTKDHIGKEAKACADADCAVGFENLTVDELYTRNGRMSPYVRGKTKSTLNVGQRKRAMVNAADSRGLPHGGVDPAGTSARCLECGNKLKYSAMLRQSGVRNLWCRPCRKVRERDGNASANIFFRTILALVMEWTGHDGNQRKTTLPVIIATLRDAMRHRGLSGPQRSMLSDIMRTLEGRSAGAEWRPPGAHKPGRRNPARGERVGGSGVGGFGRNGPGPPNAAKLCVGDYA